MEVEVFAVGQEEFGEVGEERFGEGVSAQGVFGLGGVERGWVGERGHGRLFGGVERGAYVVQECGVELDEGFNERGKCDHRIYCGRVSRCGEL